MWAERLKTFLACATAIAVVFLQPLSPEARPGPFFSISKSALLDKIKGGWAGQTIGCTFGGPTEFRFQSTFIPDYQPLAWSKDSMKWYFENEPGLYDDIYMDLTFVEVLEREGLDAPASAFAAKFANAGYMLWHANQMARYNILNGIAPPQSGHWLNNPHADDIDFEIEADFAGLMSPGLVNAAAEVCDRVGHIMNYGDGYYGGLYVAAMYSLAFVEADVHRVVEEALKVIPSESAYARTVRAVIQGHQQNPKDWKETWFQVQKMWGQDVGCPEGVFSPFNIDAKINSAWVVMGLLFGDGDLGRTMAISARCGDDSDCNPATAGGILGTMIGYGEIPEYWKQGLGAVEALDFKYTTISLAETYALSFKHALEMIKRNGGVVDGETVRIKVQEPKTVPLEVGFEGHFPRERRPLAIRLNEAIRESELRFDGVGFAVNGAAVKSLENGPDAVLEVEIRVDGGAVETLRMPTDDRTRRPTPLWRYRLASGAHRVSIRLLNPAPGVGLDLTDVIVYSAQPPKPAY